MRKLSLKPGMSKLGHSVRSLQKLAVRCVRVLAWPRLRRPGLGSSYISLNARSGLKGTHSAAHSSSGHHVRICIHVRVRNGSCSGPECHQRPCPEDARAWPGWRRHLGAPAPGPRRPSCPRTTRRVPWTAGLQLWVQLHRAHPLLQSQRNKTCRGCNVSPGAETELVFLAFSSSSPATREGSPSASPSMLQAFSKPAPGLRSKMPKCG